MSDAFVAYSIVVLTFFVFLNIGVLFYVAKTKLLKIERCLDKCSWVTDTRDVWLRSGVIGAFHRIGIIYLVCLIPEFFQKKKVADIEQVLSLDKRLRFWVLIPYTTLLVAAGLTVSLYPWARDL